MKEILSLLEKDCRLTPEQLGTMLGVDASVIEEKIAQAEKDQVILGYNALVDWDKAGEEKVTALIEVKITPQRGFGFDRIAERIYQYDEVESLYLMSGGYDLSVIVTGKTMKDVSVFVGQKLATIEGVNSTATHFIMNKYKEKGHLYATLPEQEERMMFV